MTDYRDYCFDIQSGDIPLIIGCNSKTAYHFNDSESNLRLCCGFRSSHSRQSTPETPNPSVVEDSNWYALRREPQAIRRGIRFGAAGKVDFKLANFPGTNRVSKLHFRMVLSEFNTWILIDESAAGTRVNEEKLVSRRALQNASKRGVNIQGNSQVALRPQEPNAIEIGSLNFNIYIHCDPADYQIEPDYLGMPSLELLELQSSSSLPTRGRSDPGLQSRMANAQYFLADDQLVASDNPWVRKMVHKDTGAVFIAKIYAETRINTGRDLYQRLRGILKSSQPGNIIPFLSRTTIGDEFMIITDYWPQTVSLQQLLEDDDIECLPSGAALGFMFAQLMRALLFLAEHNVIHRDIKPAAILLADKRHYAIGQLMTARLSGFSESVVGSVAKDIVGNERYRAPEMNGSLYDAKVDVYALSKLVKECLSLREAYLRKDPVSEIAALGLMEDAAERPSASHLCQSFDLFGGGHYETAFHTFYVRRRFVLKCANNLGEPEQTHVRVADLFEVLRAYKSYTPFMEPGSLGPLKEIVHLGKGYNGSYCTLNKALKVLEKCDCVGIDFLSHRSKTAVRAWSEISHFGKFLVYYHAPSMMVNISNVLNITGDAGVRACSSVPAPNLVQEVRGMPGLEGNYIDRVSFDTVCQVLKDDARLEFSVETTDLKSINSLTLRDRFTAIDSSKYVILATPRIIPDLILVDREDCSVQMQRVRAKEQVPNDPSSPCSVPQSRVSASSTRSKSGPIASGAGSQNCKSVGLNIEPDWIPPYKAMAECEDIGLLDLSLIVNGLLIEESRSLNWKRFELAREMLPMCDTPTTAASPSSSSGVFILNRPNWRHKTPVSEEDPRRPPGILSEEEEKEYYATVSPRTKMTRLPPSTITPTTFVREDKRASYNSRVSTARRTEMTDDSVSGKGPSHTRAMATTDLESTHCRELSYDDAEENDSKTAHAVPSPASGGRDLSNRYDGFVASQRSASKRVLEPSRLETYKSVQAPGPSQTRGSSIDDWLDGQRSLNINLIPRGDLYRTSDMSEEDEEEVPKKRRSLEKKLSQKLQNVPNKKSQSSSPIRSQTRRTTAQSSKEQNSRL